MTIIEKARELAKARHAHLFRPNKAKQPVIEHLAEVAQLVQDAGGSPDCIAAAWLHDSVEDTDTTLEEIRQVFGGHIADLVDGLTDPPEFADMPLQQRKQLQAERLKDKSHEVKLIKLCDQISNIRSVQTDPPLDWTEEKCQTYIAGAKAIAIICAGLNQDLDVIVNNIPTS